VKRTTTLFLIGLTTLPWAAACAGSECEGSLCATPGTAGDEGETGNADETGDAGETGYEEGTGMATEGTGPNFDVGGDGDGDTGEGSCKVEDGDLDAVAPCKHQAPPDSFEAQVQWSFSGQGADDMAIAAPVVVNLTDDNDDGEVDLCDVPDVVVPLYYDTNPFGNGHLYVLDGATGELHYSLDAWIAPRVHPAVGDIDGDGVAEIVTAHYGNGFMGYLAAYENDGSLKWVGDEIQTGFHAIALADLDNDGDVEIMIGGHVADHEGNEIFTSTSVATSMQTTIAADLDGDQDLEVIQGPFAWHHDGSPYYAVEDLSRGHSAVADLDEDGLPEVLVMGDKGVTVLEHDGTVKVKDAKPMANPGGWYWQPPAIHDMDGDGAPEIALGTTDLYGVVEADLTVAWTAPVTDSSGFAGGTAFDFLGSGTAQGVYADEATLFVFDADGQVLTQSPRSSATQIEFPVVVDVDADDSAEMVVVSNEIQGAQTQPAVQVIRDKEDRWVPARRIWNQHSYHVTNVREDGTIPQFEAPSWESFNTYRTQAQFEDGGVCVPEG
jgi:hypothetical protein